MDAKEQRKQDAELHATSRAITSHGRMYWRREDVEFHDMKTKDRVILTQTLADAYREKPFESDFSSLHDVICALWDTENQLTVFYEQTGDSEPDPIPVGFMLASIIPVQGTNELPIHTMFTLPSARALGLKSLFAAMLWEGVGGEVWFEERRGYNTKMLRWFKGAAQHAKKDWAVLRTTYGGAKTIERPAE